MDTRDKARLTRIEQKLEQIISLLNEQAKPVRYYTVKEVAKIIGYSASHVRKLIQQGRIGTASNQGKKILIPEEALVHYQEEYIG